MANNTPLPLPILENLGIERGRPSHEVKPSHYIAQYVQPLGSGHRDSDKRIPYTVKQ